VGGILSSTGSNQTRSQNAPLWESPGSGQLDGSSTKVNGWVGFLPLPDPTRQGHRMLPCGESPGSGQSDGSGPRS